MRKKMNMPMTHRLRTRITEDVIDEIIELHCNQGLSAAEAARRVGVAPSTVFKHTQEYAKAKPA
jgi:transposase-like protein